MLERSSINTYLCSMNKMPNAKKLQILNMLVEGSSMRAISRITGASINTVTRVLVDTGKEKNVPDGMEDAAGDVWTWVGIDADSKLVIDWLAASRD
eukprot:gene45975-62265_t